MNAKELPDPSYLQLARDRDVLDCRITALLDEVHAVKKIRNMKIPINAKLPPEILSLIFSYVKDFANRTAPILSYHSRSRLSWIRSTTHVCNHWRSVALSDSSLWTGGFPNHVVGMETFLSRAKNLPVLLDERFTNVIRYNSSLQPLILSQISRAWKLVLYLYESEIRAILNALDVDMPYLKVLDIRVANLSTERNLRPHIIPSFPRLQNLSHVRDLRLQACGFPWDQVELANLTSLQLIGDLNPAHDASIAQMFDVLRKSPCLSRLLLRNLVHENSLDREQMSMELSLPKLEYLDLQQNGVVFTRLFLSSAKLPEVKEVVLKTMINDATILTDILTYGARLINRSQPKNISFVHSDEAYGGYSCNIHCHTGLSLAFNNMRPSFDPAQVTLRCLGEFDTSRLFNLRCSTNKPSTVGWWNDILGNACGLNTLIIERLQDPRHILYALTPDISLSQTTTGIERKKSEASPAKECLADGKPAITVPQLNNLVFENVDFIQPSGDHQSPVIAGSIKHLAHCLSLRAKCGFKLDELTVPETEAKLEVLGVCLWEYVNHLNCASDEGLDDDGESDPYGEDLHLQSFFGPEEDDEDESEDEDEDDEEDTS